MTDTQPVERPSTEALIDGVVMWTIRNVSRDCTDGLTAARAALDARIKELESADLDLGEYRFVIANCEKDLARLEAENRTLALQLVESERKVGELSGAYGSLWLAADWFRRSHDADELFSTMGRLSHFSPPIDAAMSGDKP